MAAVLKEITQLKTTKI